MDIDYPFDFTRWDSVMPEEMVKELDITGRRAWVVGDIHGMFGRLQEVLNKIGFNPEQGDLLISVGDLIDRGEDSLAALDWLQKPWFHAVRGNHEEFIIDTFFHSDEAIAREAREVWINNGGDWYFLLPEADANRCRDLAAEARKLPYALDIRRTGANARRFGVVHADHPENLDWDSFLLALRSQVKPALKVATWGRKAARLVKMRHQLDPVDGLDYIFHGHTPMRTPTRSGNRIFIDTGAAYGGQFTLIPLHDY